LDDEQLIELFLERDERAIAETQAAYGARLRQLAYRLLGNSEDAEECLNDTYFKIWNAIPPQSPRSLTHSVQPYADGQPWICWIKGRPANAQPR